MPFRFLVVFHVFSDNLGEGGNSVDDMMMTLERIGVPENERKRIKEYYGDDLDGMSEYVLYMRAMLDDFDQYYE